MSNGEPIEQQVVDAVLKALRDRTRATGVIEGEPPSELTNENLPFLWVMFDVSSPEEFGTNHSKYELVVTARGAFKIEDDVFREGRTFVAEQQRAVMHDFTQSRVGSGDTRPGPHTYGQTAEDGIGGTEAQWIVKFLCLRDDPTRDVDQ